MNRVWSSQGVSPVVAVILMVAITVILSAVIGTFVLDLGQSATDGSQSNIGVTTTEENGNFTVTVVTGSADNMSILVNGNKSLSKGNISPGDTMSVSVSSGDKVTVVTGKDGSRSVTLSTTISNLTTTQSGQSIPSDGLVSYYPFDGNGSDMSGSNDGTLNGDPVFVTGHDSDAVRLDGSGDYVEIPHDSSLNVSSITISLWIRYNSSASATYPVIASKTPHTDAWTLRPGMWRVVTDSGSDNKMATNQAAPDGKWVHLVATYNASTGKQRVYFNGTLDTEATLSGNLVKNNNVLRLGWDDKSDEYTAGKFDEVRIYNRSLSSAEVDDLYNSTK